MIELDKQYSLGDLALGKETYPCIHCGSDETECRGFRDDGVVVVVYFKCWGCRHEYTHIMGMELELWRRIKIAKGIIVEEEQ